MTLIPVPQTMRSLRTLSLLAPLLMVAAVPAHAQQADGAAILRATAARARAQMDSVRDFTVTMTLLGEPLTLHASRQGPAGRFHFGYASSGERSGVLGVPVALLDQVRVLAMQFAAGEPAVTYGGVGTETGAPAYRLAIADPGDSIAPPGVRSLTMHVDTASKLVRRITVALNRPGGASTDVGMDLSDWRAVGGMMVPYHRRFVGHGMRGAGAAAIQGEIDRTRQQMAVALGPQRTSLQRVIDMLQGVLDRDEMVFDVDVTSATVNAGPPTGVPLRPLGS